MWRASVMSPKILFSQPSLNRSLWSMCNSAYTCILWLMGDTEAAETAEDLLAAAQEAGFEVTRDQLHRWQREGLLPRPRQRGLGHGLGTEVIYPPGSARQLVALREQLEIKRSFIDAAWVLWWNRYWVSERWIRALFNTKAVQLERVRVKEEQGDLKPDIDKWGRGSLPHSVLRTMRRLTGADEFPVAANSLLKFILGNFDGFPDGGAETTATSVGFPASDGLEEQLRATSPAYDPRRLREALDASSLEDLEAARDDVRAALELSGGFMALVLAEGEVDRRLSQPFTVALKRPSLDTGLYLVLLWLSVRCSPRMQEIYEAFISLVRDAAKEIMDPPADVLEDKQTL